MKNTTEKFNPGKIQLIKRSLETQTEQGAPLFYEIYVDSLVVVRKTKETQWFNNHESFVNKDTQRITIKIYASENSHRYSKHIFLLKEDRQEIAYESIHSEIEKKLSERICFERNLWEKEQIKKELEETKGKLAEAEQYNDALIGLIENIRLKVQQ